MDQVTRGRGKRARAALAGSVALGVLLAGCGGTPAGAGADRGSSGDGAGSSHGAMSGMKMADDTAAGPSASARMVCEEDEIRDAVRRTFRMHHAPTSTHTWSAADRVYACRWAVPHGTLVVTVQDATDPTAGHRYFERLRSGLAGARPIRGMDSFGFPAASTTAGDVLFLKDGKTLHVDATGLPAASLPPAFARSEVAYSVAAAVIGCWTE